MDQDHQANISQNLKPASSRRIKAEELFDDNKELIIEHHGKEYRLRITSNDKLILTK